MIVDIARSFIGQKEKSGNMGFVDPEFDKLMKAVGHREGESWCVYFSEMVAKKAYPKSHDILDKLFSGSAVQTFKNFNLSGQFKISQTPVLGSVVIWQTQKKGKPHWTGHAGIVVEVLSPTTFKSVEGNTNNSGGREGIEVALKLRKVQPIQNGLKVLGFIILK